MSKSQDKKRHLLFLNGMPFEMVIDQGRMWEIESRNMCGYCEESYSIYYGSLEEKTVVVSKGRNICYCMRDRATGVRNNILRYIYRFLLVLHISFRIGSICKKHDIDAIVSNSSSVWGLGIAALIISKFLDIPYFAYMGRNITGLDKHRGTARRLIHKLESMILRNADRTILRPSTEKIFAEYFGLDHSRIVSIPHVTRFHKFVESSKMREDMQKTFEGKKVVLYYGRLEADKLVEDLINAYRLVREDFKETLLLLIGDGRHKNELEKLVDRHGLNEFVIFKPPMSQIELASVSQRADIHVHPTGGKGLLESAVIGKPVIVYENSSWEYGLVKHMITGLKVKSRNIEELAESIAIYLRDPELGLTLGNALQIKALEQHDWNNVQLKLACEIENAILEKKLGSRKDSYKKSNRFEEGDI